MEDNQQFYKFSKQSSNIALMRVIIESMDQQFDLNPQDYIIPSQGHFGNRQFISFTTKITNHELRQSIISTRFNAQYESKKWLCEKLSEETHLLVQEIISGKFSQDQCSIYYLKRILKHIVKDADEGGMTLEHKILYLTFKFLLHLICKRAGSNNIQIQDKVTLHQWLTDADALFYKTASPTNNSNAQNIEEEMIENLRVKDYEALLINLQTLGAVNQDESKKKTIEIITKMVILKIENTQRQVRLQSRPEELRIAQREVLLALQNNYAEIANNGKKENSSQQSRDKLRFIGEVLQRNPVYLNTLVKGSWPLYVSHICESQPAKQADYVGLKKQGLSYLARIKEPYQPETEYLLTLLQNKQLHVIYQSLFNLVAPYYSHLITYHFYYFYEAAPLLVLMEKDYMNDLVRNMLLHASHVSYICLFLTFRVVENNEWIQRKAEMFEPLLYYHLSVVDVEDQAEVSQFLRKINLLSALSLQKYAYSHFKRVFLAFIDHGQLNASVIESYLVLSTLYAKYSSSDFDLIGFIERYFVSKSLSPQSIREILSIGNKLDGKKKYKRQLQKFQKILPSFDRFIWLQEAKSEANIQNKIKISIRLMKITMRSLPLTQLIKDIIFAQRQQDYNYFLCQQYNQQKVGLLQQFQKIVRRYIDHYPKYHSEAEEELIRAIDSVIG